MTGNRFMKMTTEQLQDIRERACRPVAGPTAIPDLQALLLYVGELEADKRLLDDLENRPVYMEGFSRAKARAHLDSK
jgi:hypothetical protein